MELFKLTMPVNLGELLKHAELELPKKVPIAKDFDLSAIIGTAEIKQRKGNVVGEMFLIEEPKVMEKFRDYFELGVEGVIIEKRDNIITRFEIKCVAIQLKDPNALQNSESKIRRSVSR